jgi:hypothetical protein
LTLTTIITIGYIFVCGISLKIKTSFGRFPWRFYRQGVLCAGMAYVLCSMVISADEAGMRELNPLGVMAALFFAFILGLFSIDRMLMAHKAIA